MDVINGKKLSIRYFLNTRLKPQIKDDIETYPIYVQISYDRKNVQLKFSHDNILPYRPHLRNKDFNSDNYIDYFSEEEFEKILVLYEKYLINISHETKGNEIWYIDETAEFLASYSEIIASSVELEIGKKGEKFKLKGLRNYLTTYSRSILALLDFHLPIHVWASIQDNIDNHISFLEIFDNDSFYEAFERLFRLKYLEKLDAQVKLDIELYFVVASFIDSGINDTDDRVINCFKSQFYLLFEQFYKKTFLNSPKDINLSIENFFYRYIHLTPPTKPFEYYATRIKKIIDENLGIK